jgi:hypothetical protein
MFTRKKMKFVHTLKIIEYNSINVNKCNKTKKKKKLIQASQITQNKINNDNIQLCSHELKPNKYTTNSSKNK